MTDAKKVVVVGGGYGGVAVAKTLDDVADVVLVEPRETFVHNVAALRAMVDPEWPERLFIPYDGLLNRGRVHHDWAVRVSADRVELAGGAVLPADFVVLATGAVYPFPGKPGPADPDWFAATRRSLLAAGSILLVGAGPIGLDLAGEIKSAWPEKRVTVAGRSPVLMPGFPDEFRRELTDQLSALGVELRLGITADQAGPHDFTFDSFGTPPDTGYLDPALAGARDAGGRLTVTPELRLPGVPTVFAVGDVTAVPEMKTARIAGLHADIVAANIRSLIDGDGGLKTYTAAPDAIVLTLGPHAGVSYIPGTGVLGPGPTAEIRADYRLAEYRLLLGA
ncbi:FAD-dependent oxidoreductase [Actinoplanes sp. NPDC049265]|uniref:FAD-dependent oxidoreductase n=1 Tax=Actinoplanes sp. NPDC049265 TaxID=3363902 RepID=UPI0037166013